MFGVQSDVFVEVTRIAKRPGTDGTFERFVSGVRPNVNFQSVLARIDFAAVNAYVAVFGSTHVTDYRLHLSGARSRRTVSVIVGHKWRQE